MSYPVFSDEYFMNEALKEAGKAFDREEVPIGCVLVTNRQIIGKGHNLVEQMRDVTAHAEIMAITAAAQFFNTKYLPDATLYVTLEPCAMCAAAIGWAQIPRLVFGASDEKKGYRLFSEKVLHPRCEVTAGILAAECGVLIKTFFQQRRN